MRTKVKWNNWDKKYFDLAKKNKVPILLDLTASWCHWCKKMDEDNYDNPEVAKIINKGFIPIRVDVDKRPDLAERYNMGGFPTTAFLTPEGSLIWGGTYLYPQDFKRTLYDVREKYKSNPQAFAVKGLKPSFPEKLQDVDLNEALKNIDLRIENSYDGSYGGFGIEPKFPNAEIIDLLLFNYITTKEKKWLEMVTKTLGNMAKGIYDAVDGGFFRYSVATDWSIPHYEKMLDVNASMLRVYSNAYNLTRDSNYKKIALGIINYVNSFLYDKKSAFYGSQDADEDFYKLSKSERAGHTYPSIDKTIYTNWNCLVISSYLRAYGVFKNKSYYEIAVSSLDFLLKNCYDKKTGMYHYFNKKPFESGYLTDNISMMSCLIDAYEVTLDNVYLDKAEEILSFLIKKFYHKDLAFIDRLPRKDDIGLLKVKGIPLIDNSIAAVSIKRLYHLTSKDSYKKISEEILNYLCSEYKNYGILAAIYGYAIKIVTSNGIKFELIGNKNSLKSFHEEILSFYHPAKSISYIDDKKEIDKKGYILKNNLAVYICGDKFCSPPIYTIEALQRILSEISSR